MKTLTLIIATALLSGCAARKNFKDTCGYYQGCTAAPQLRIGKIPVKVSVTHSPTHSRKR